MVTIEETIMDISLSVEEKTNNITIDITPVGLRGPKGDNAFKTWLEDNPNGTKEEYYSFIKGEPFRFEDFTAEQLEFLKGEKGDAFTFTDFTPEQIESLKVKGDKGEDFKYEDFTPEQLEALKVKGDEGKDAFEVWQERNPSGTYKEYQESIRGRTGDMPTEELNAFLSNFFDPSIVALSSRGNLEGATFEQKLRFVQNEIDAMEEKPSLLMIPSAYKEGKLYSVIPSDGSGDFTVERNSDKWVVGKDGYLVRVPPNVPAFDWSTGEPMVLVEGKSTNLEVKSAYPDYRNSPISTRFIEAPDGTISAGIPLVEDIGDRWEWNISGTSGQKFVLSWYSETIVSNGFTGNIYFNGAINGVWGPTEQIENDINGFNRYSAMFTITATGAATLRGYLINSSGSGGNTENAAYWGLQLEEGSKATSYIPTNGSIATRLADNIYNTLPASGEVVIHFADGTTQTIIGTAGEIFTLPEGLIKKVEMI